MLAFLLLLASLSHCCWALSAVAGFPGICVSAVTYIPPVAGVPAVASFLAVDGALAVDGFPVDPNVPMLF